MAAGGAFHDGDVHDVVVASLPGDHTHPASLLLAHRLDIAHGQEAGQAGLSATTVPRLG